MPSSQRDTSAASGRPGQHRRHVDQSLPKPCHGGGALTTEGVISAVTATCDLAGLVARLPAEPSRLPPGLEATLGPDGARRFYGLLHTAVVERIGVDPGGLGELTPFVVGGSRDGVPRASAGGLASRDRPLPRRDGRTTSRARPARAATHGRVGSAVHDPSDAPTLVLRRPASTIPAFRDLPAEHPPKSAGRSAGQYVPQVRNEWSRQ